VARHDIREMKRSLSAALTSRDPALQQLYKASAAAAAVAVAVAKPAAASGKH
jgi:hypothetical protein